MANDETEPQAPAEPQKAVTPMATTSPSSQAPALSDVEKIEHRAKALALMRDGIITGASVVYVCGYVVWSYNAWRNNLGLLPAIQYQYFVAGLPLVFIAILVLAVIVAAAYCEVIATHVAHKVTSRFKHQSHKWISFFILIGLALAMITGTTAILRKTISDKMLLSIVLAFFAYLNISISKGIGAYIAWNESEYKKSVKGVPKLTDLIHAGFKRTLSNQLHGSAVQIWALVSVLFGSYLSVGYASIPQEFGGMRPRCAYLDLKKANLSWETSQDILPTVTQKSYEGGRDVARSIMVDVYFVGSSSMLLRPHGFGVDTPVIEVKSDLIQSVKWCSSVPQKASKANPARSKKPVTVKPADSKK